MRKILFVPIYLIFIFLCTENINAAVSLHIEGFVKDSQTSDPLIGTNVILVGTSFGSAADINGKYTN